MNSQPQIVTRDARITNALLKILDSLVIIGTAGVSYISYLSFEEIPSIYTITTVYVTLVALLVFSWLSLYDDWGRASKSEEIRKITLGWITVFLILLMSIVLLEAGEQISRAWIVVWFFSGWCWLIGMRFIARRLEQIAYRKGFGQRTIVLAGYRSLCARAARKIEDMEILGYKIQGILLIDRNIEDLKNSTVELAPIDDLESYVSDHDINEVWIALPLKEEEQLRSIIHMLRNTAVDIRYLPDLFGMRLLNHSVASVAGLPLVNLSISPIAGINRMIKTLEDYLLSILIIVLISPLLQVIAFLVKTTSKGPVIYKQERVSWNGKPFTMYKFRSMPVDVESATGPKWATPGENRATLLGSFLRRTGLDELPQFFNVLKGEMSIVGPRPERPVFVEEFKNSIQDYMKKHLVKAGITGWAQVNGLRGDTDLTKRIEYDLYYIENWSIWFDIRIVFLTLFKGFASKNAY